MFVHTNSTAGGVDHPRQQQPVQHQVPQQHELNADGALVRKKRRGGPPVRPVCPECGKEFSNQSALSKHKLTHSDERRYQ